eukprot:gnl/MRDRNA2_/MRDRNA2_78479_c0_seq1.p1 gnl/MRDRNA2_/MRDRNA2_78479_c0~~gnl/MRDRNA2_/MRDRNA2_78479_c0_seq1.p1  ORF type:complete len:1262 (+),score=208.83 gnl/MRDRNA2_/MRDRNA2_78479_c0_seq1:179-3787(+)
MAAALAVATASKAKAQASLLRSILIGAGRASLGRQVRSLLILELLSSSFDRVLNQLSLSLGHIWQKRMISALHKSYFNQLTFYYARDLNPHERIAVDAPKLGQDLARVACDALTVSFRLSVFSIFLMYRVAFDRLHWRSYFMMVAPFFHAIVCYATMQGVSPSAAALQRRQRELESTYRRYISRIKRHAEQITIAGGEALEEAQLQQHLAAVARHGGQTLWALFAFDALKDFLNRQLQQPLLVFFALGLSRRNLGGSSPSAASLANNTAATRLLWDINLHLMQVLGQAVQLLPALRHLSEHVAKVGSFAADLRLWQHWQTDWNARVQVEEGDVVAFQNATICTSSGRVLFTGLTLEVQQGQPLLICGHSGCGKTALARCLAGLWPVAEGRIIRPADEDLVYVPQRPLVVPGHSFYEQVCYPSHPKPSDRQVIDSLRRLVGLNSSSTVKAEAPLADHQRLALSRLLWKKPSFAVLDGATTALSDVEESVVLKACATAGVTLLTVSNRSSLQQHHSRILVLEGHRKWRLETIAPPEEAPEEASSSYSAAEGRWQATRARHQRSDCSDRSRSPTDRHFLLSPTVSHISHTSRYGFDHRPSPPNQKEMAVSEVQPLPVSLLQRGLHFFCRRDLLAVGLLALFALLRSWCTERAAWFTARALLRASADRSKELPRLAALLTLLGVGQAVAASALTHTATMAALLCRQRLSTWLLHRCLESQRLFSQDLSERLERALTEDSINFATGVWRLLGNIAQQVADLLMLWKGAHRILSDRGRVTLQDVLILGTAAVLRAATVGATQKLAQSPKFWEAHSRLRREAELVAFARFQDNRLEDVKSVFHSQLQQERDGISRKSDFLGCFGGAASQTLCQQVLWTQIGFRHRQSLDEGLSVAVSSGAEGNFVSNELAMADAGQDLSFLSSVFAQSTAALGTLMGCSARLSAIIGPATRLWQLTDAVETLEGNDAAAGPSGHQIADQIVLEDVDVRDSKENHLLAAGLSLTLQQQQGSLLICGPDGVGKTTVARTMCGIHPAASGVVKSPPKGKIQYLAAKAYFPIGTLRDQVTYPTRCSCSFTQPLGQDANEALPRCSDDDLKIKEALRDACLEDLAERVGMDTVSERWSDMLSMGEQQRLAFARLLWHCPTFAILDQCTSALSLQVEEALITACQRSGIVLVTLSRRPTLQSHHTRVLLLEGGGKWRLDVLRPDP